MKKFEAKKTEGIKVPLGMGVLEIGIYCYLWGWLFASDAPKSIGNIEVPVYVWWMWLAYVLLALSMVLHVVRLFARRQGLMKAAQAAKDQEKLEQLAEPSSAKKAAPKAQEEAPEPTPSPMEMPEPPEFREPTMDIDEHVARQSSV